MKRLEVLVMTGKKFFGVTVIAKDMKSAATKVAARYEGAKAIRRRVFNTYSSARRPWYVTWEVMNKRSFNKYVSKDWRTVEFAECDRGRQDTDEPSSWEHGYYNTLHD